MVDTSKLNEYSRTVSVVSFVMTSILALVSIFSKHPEMPGYFKGLVLVLLAVSACLLRYILGTLYDRGCRSMVYTLALHGTLFAVTVVGAKLGAYK